MPVNEDMNKFEDILFRLESNLSATPRRRLANLDNYLLDLESKLKRKNSDPVNIPAFLIRNDLIGARYYLQTVGRRIKGSSNEDQIRYQNLVNRFVELYSKCNDQNLVDDSIKKLINFLDTHKVSISEGYLDIAMIYELVSMLAKCGDLVKEGSFALNINYNEHNKPVFKTYSGLNYPNQIYRLDDKKTIRNFKEDYADYILHIKERVDLFLKHFQMSLAKILKVSHQYYEIYKGRTILVERDKPEKDRAKR
jgi:hypothetical protein